MTAIDTDACVEATLTRIGKRIVLGLPVGVGKPNKLVNAFVQRALADRSIQLTIFTGLSFRKPRWKSDLERRFLQPFFERVFGSYPELEYIRLLEQSALPANIQVNEFFLEPGGWLRNPHLQQHYLSANYTHVTRDLIARGANVIAQLVATSPDHPSDVSLSCNPDITVELLPYVEAQRASGNPIVLVGQPHPELPFMFGDSVVPRAMFDFMLDDADYPLFCPPNMPIGNADYLIALHVASLVKDGGTLQLGIGELGDAIVYALKLRHEQPDDFAALIASLHDTDRAALVEREGGKGRFTTGLYGCSEMLVDGFLDLYRAGILKRRVYPHARLQTLVDSGKVTAAIGEETLAALAECGMDVITRGDFLELQQAGVFHEAVRYEAGELIGPMGARTAANVASVEQRHALRTHLGSTLRNGVLVHGGFYFGPREFYEALHTLPEEERKLFAMQRIGFINELYGEQQALKVAQRRDARFVNTTMMMTALGAAVSDGLADGQVVSGVGGQYNFVAMAHALPNARSILCLRSTRTARGKTTSNIVWNYGHTTIPRHLRDIVVTEYGIADLRGKTDSEVIAAMIQIADARFQDGLISEAKRAGKLAPGYQIPESARRNAPAALDDALRPYRARGLFDPLPFGGAFTADELLIAKALKNLQMATATRSGKLTAIAQAVLTRCKPQSAHLLARLGLDRPTNLAQRVERRLVVRALRNVS